MAVNTRGVADVVFCIDASDSMTPCLEGVKSHVSDFVEGLSADANMSWDVRLEFIAHSAGGTDDNPVFRFKTMRHDRIGESLYGGQGSFFTSDIAEFQNTLARIKPDGNEAPLVALDCALDLPWRPAAECHRVVIMLTDEPLETGVIIQEQLSKLDTLIDKIQQLRVMLFIVAPESDGLMELASADRSSYEETEQAGDGLASVDFRDILSGIGKSVSKSVLQMPRNLDVPRGLFGQQGWTRTDRAMGGE